MIVMKKRLIRPMTDETQGGIAKVAVTEEKVERANEETPRCVSSDREPDDNGHRHDNFEQGKTVRLSFSIDWELHRRLKLEAVRSCRSLSGMVEQWIGEHTSAA
jgi:hypothetical protein